MIEFRGTRRFEIVRRLGAGGMGVVYEATDLERNARVALKTLRTMSPEALLLFKNEFRALQDVSHPNLVNLGELVEEDGQWFFTMGLVDGVDFVEYVRPDPSAPVGFDEERLRDALAQLADGIRAIHAASQVHRDLKPSNIRVTPEGRVVLLDFGLVEPVGARHSGDAHIVGSAAYMAPEQAAQRPAGTAADWYSFGVLLWEALVGDLPFRGSPQRVLLDKQDREPPAPSEVASGIPEDLDRLCVELLRPEPEERAGAQRVRSVCGAAPRAAGSATSSGLRAGAAPPFVGREEELARLDRAFEEALEGEPALVEVRGDSGLGKTEFVKRFLERIESERPDAAVLEGRCYERESLPYKAVDGVADALSRLLGALPRDEVEALLFPRAPLVCQLFPVLRGVPALDQAPMPSTRDLLPAELRGRMFGAFRELLARLARQMPLVVFIDDLQWADADSVSLLSEVLAGDAPPLLLIATFRTGSTGPAIDATEALLERARRIELAPLRPAEAERLVALLSPELSARRPEQARHIAGEASGHPMFIQELCRHAGGGAAEEAAVTRLDEALWARVAELPEAARELLATVVVGGAPLAQNAVVRALESRWEDYDREVARLRAAHLVRLSGSGGRDTVEPYHDRVRAAVLSHLGERDRIDRHRRIAAALEETGAAEDDPEALFYHLDAAGDRPRAAEHAGAAARRAAGALAFERAADLYRQALELGDHGPEEARELTAARGEALANAGRGADAAEALLTAADGAELELNLDYRTRAAEQLLVSGHIARGLQLLSELLAELGVSMPRSRWGVLSSILWHRARVRIRGLRWKRRTEREISPELLRLLDLYRAAGRGLSTVDPVRGSDFQVRALLLALRAGEPRRIAHALSLEAGFRATQGSGKIRRGRELLEEARAIADELEDPYLSVFVEGCRGLVAFYEGRFQEVVDLVAELDGRFEEIGGSIWEQNALRMFRLIAHRFLGDVEDQKRLCGSYLRDAARRGDRQAASFVTSLSRRVWLADDRPEECARRLDEVAWIGIPGAFHVQQFFELEARGEVALYEGRAAELWDAVRERYEDLARAMLLRIETTRSEYYYLRGRLALAAAARGRAAARGDAEKMARKLDGEQKFYAHVWAHLLHAGLEASAGDRVVAAGRLRRAIEIAAEHDMRLYAAAAERFLGDLLGGEEGAAARARGDENMRACGVVAPEKMTRVVTS